MILHSKPIAMGRGEVYVGFSTNFSKKGVDTPVEDKEEVKEEFITEEEFKV